jgi:hypothetical protein
VIATAFETVITNLPATLVAAGALLVSVGTLVQSLRNGKKADAAAVKAVEAVTKAEEQAGAIDTIKTNTDGHLADLRNEIALARQEIGNLKAERERVAVETALATPAPEL